MVNSATELFPSGANCDLVLQWAKSMYTPPPPPLSPHTEKSILTMVLGGVCVLRIQSSDMVLLRLHPH